MTEIKAVDFHRIIRDASAFASRDDMLPMLNGIRLEAADGNLIAVATDRFTLGASRTDWGGPDFECHIPLRTARLAELVAAGSRRRGERATRTVDLSWDGEVLTMDYNTGEVLALTGSALAFPKWRHLIADPGDEPGANLYAVDPQKIAQFARVGGGVHQMQVLHTTPAKQIMVAIGADFLGIIMPIRLNGERWERPGWVAKP